MFLHLFATLNTPRCKFRQCFPASMAAASDPGSWTSQWEKRCRIAFKICYVPQKNHELSPTVEVSFSYSVLWCFMLKSLLNVRLQQLEISEVAAQRASVQRLSRPKSAKHVGFPRSVHGRNQMHQFLKVCPVLPCVAWCCAWCHGLIFFQGHAFADEMEMQERHWHLDGNLYHC